MQARTPVSPIITDRPDFTESAETVPPGMLQLEGGYTLSETGGLRTHALGELLLRVALTSRMEARIGMNSYNLVGGTDASAGVDDSSIGIKLKLLDGSGRVDLARPAVSLILMASLPTGAAGRSAGASCPTAKLLLAWDLGPGWDVAANLNYTYSLDSGSRYHQMAGSVTVGHEWSARLGTYLEVYGFNPAQYRGPGESYVNAGVTYLVTPGYQLDLRAGRGLGGERHDYFIGVGAARRW